MAIGNAILIAMPWTCYETLDDAAFAERTSLVRACVVDGAQRALMAENRHCIAIGQLNDARAPVGNRKGVARIDELPLADILKR